MSKVLPVIVSGGGVAPASMRKTLVISILIVCIISTVTQTVNEMFTLVSVAQDAQPTALALYAVLAGQLRSAFRGTPDTQGGLKFNRGENENQESMDECFTSLLHYK